MINSSKHPSLTFHQHESGIALLVAIIFMTVVLSIGLSLSSFGYKQITLVSSVTDSQKAFYAADSAIECVLYADQHNAAFFNTSYHPHATSFTCNNNVYAISTPITKVLGARTWQVYDLPVVSFGTTCSSVIVYKDVAGGAVGETYIFSTGYNNKNCSANNKTTVRGLETHYGGN